MENPLLTKCICNYIDNFNIKLDVVKLSISYVKLLLICYNKGAMFEWFNLCFSR